MNLPEDILPHAVKVFDLIAKRELSPEEGADLLLLADDLRSPWWWRPWRKFLYGYACEAFWMDE